MNKYNLILEGSQNHKLLRRMMTASITPFGKVGSLSSNPTARSVKYQQLKNMFSSDPKKAKDMLRFGAKRLQKQKYRGLNPIIVLPRYR